METITIEFNRKSKAGRIFLEFVETFVKDTKGVRIKNRKKEDVLEKIFSENNFTDKEKTFYRNYKKAIDQSRAIDAGESKEISLDKTLDEI